ncbi:MAG TPA: FRG domain-containing protein [Thermoanaerobaculia bacterium]|nr:FRG domain-containing protein [Thermoanaerobaculia bacterium]
MQTIGEQELWSFYRGDSPEAQRAKTCSAVRQGPGYRVRTFLELATRVAELQFRNRDYVLLFRGQTGDYRNARKNTTLKPSLFRPFQSKNPTPGKLVERFEILKKAEQELVSRYVQQKLLGVERLKRHRILRWAILQHYEVCPTPLLDVTHSLRIAASFASHPATNEAFVFVLGVPNLSGAITASAEAGLQIVRLSSVCPPTAVRPHIQEGYLLGEYPEMSGSDQKDLYQHYEIDFGRRLVAKFCFDPEELWKKNDAFPKVEKDALYPSADDDPLYRLALEVKAVAQ